MSEQPKKDGNLIRDVKSYKEWAKFHGHDTDHPLYQVALDALQSLQTELSECGEKNEKSDIAINAMNDLLDAYKKDLGDQQNKITQLKQELEEVKKQLNRKTLEEAILLKKTHQIKDYD